MLEAGYVLLSIDYRLAPETQLPFIIEDVENAFDRVHAEVAQLFNADTNRIAVMGPRRAAIGNSRPARTIRRWPG
jgi:acetyl esterase/lipase